MSEKTNFITGTGRCGSTILSRMLMLHPDALILREFLAMLDFRMLDHGEVSGDGLAVILNGDLHPLILFLQRGGTLPEILYRLSEKEKKQPYWSRPGITLGALPYISDEPDELHADMIEWAKRQPTAPLRVHYPKLFRFIAEKTGRSIPIEASAAGNIDLEVFPNSRILQIHRSGPEVVLSMCAHPWFRMLSSILIDPLSEEEFQVAVECSAPEETDPILKRLNKDDRELYPVLIKIYTSIIAQNYRVLQHVAPENYMEVNFEEFAADPKPQLRRIAAFFELPDIGERWMDEAADMIRPVKLRLPEQPKDIQVMLKNACFAGEVLTGRQPRKTESGKPVGLEKKLFAAHKREPEPLV